MRKKALLFLWIFTMALLVLFFVVGCKKSGPVDYYPLGVGSFWEYNVLAYMEGGLTKVSKEIVMVIGKDRVGDVESYIVDRYAIEGGVPSVCQYREYLAKTEKGVECMRRSFPLLYRLKGYFPSIQTDITHTPPEERFKNNLKDGDTWKWKGIVGLVPVQEKQKKDSKEASKPPQIRQIKGSIEYKYLGHEKIKVLNQEMDCIKISMFSKNEVGQELESTIWYAPNIGRVREEQKFYEGSKGIQFVFEISNYSLMNIEPFKKR